MKNPMKFIQEVKQEAFKVSWPTWKETLQGALMVFANTINAPCKVSFHVGHETLKASCFTS